MKKNNCSSIIKYFPFALCIMLILCYISYSEEISVQTIIKYTPKNPFMAAIILLLMYALKSTSIVFPLIILEIAGGHLFSTIPAIFINAAGIFVCHLIPYWIGRFSGTNLILKLANKYSIIESIIQKQNNNSFFMCFFLRTLHCLPGDAVSIFLGAIKTPFKRYIIASTLGSLPNTILATLFGASITKPTSPMFWISSVFLILFSACSLFVYYCYKRKSIPKNY